MYCTHAKEMLSGYHFFFLQNTHYCMYAISETTGDELNKLLQLPFKSYCTVCVFTYVNVYVY